MILAYLLAIVIDPVSTAAGGASSPPHVYLHPPTDGCDSRAHDDEVVVCGSKDLGERYRLRPQDDTQYREKPIRAEAKIGNATIALKADPQKIGDAQDDVYFKRRYTDLRLRLTIPF